MSDKRLSHTDRDGNASMVDVGAKPDCQRTAIATGFIALAPDTIKLIEDNMIKKGDVLSIAEFAGIVAAKKTSELIPLCHQLNLTSVNLTSKIEDGGVRVNAISKCNGKTGVEMESLTAVSIALLTIYDMCKAVDKNMCVTEIKLLEKTKADI